MTVNMNDEFAHDEAVVSSVKRKVGSTTLSDDEILEIYHQNGENVNCTAADIWSQKAAAAGDLIDIQEGASTRKMSQLASQAENRAKYFRDLCEGDTTTPPASRPTRTAQIVRP